MTLQEAKEQAAKENGYFGWSNLFGANTKIFNRAVELYANPKLQEKELEIQKLHDHYQKQTGEWEELLKAYEEYQSVLIDEIYSLAPIATAHGWKSALTEQGKACRERIESLKHQTK